MTKKSFLKWLANGPSVTARLHLYELMINATGYECVAEILKEMCDENVLSMHISEEVAFSGGYEDIYG